MRSGTAAALACFLLAGCLGAAPAQPPDPEAPSSPSSAPEEPARQVPIRESPPEAPAPEAPVAAPATAPAWCNPECAVPVATGTYREFEPMVAINPLHPSIVAISAAEDLMADAPGYLPGPIDSPVTGSPGLFQTPGSYRIGIHTSTDGGATWATHFLPWTGNAPPASRWNLYCVYGDPLLFYAPDGTLHVISVAAQCATELKADQAFHLIHAASKDDGATWGEPSLVAAGWFAALANDKPWAAIDPHGGRIAVAWTQFVALGLAAQVLMVEVSDDGGTTWSLPHPAVLGGELARLAKVPLLDEPAYNYFLSVTWGQDHGMLVSYLGYCDVPPPPNANPDCIKLARSDDAGATWLTGIVVAHIADPGRPGARHIQENYAALAVDRSGGPHEGRIYDAFLDATTGDYDVVLAWSDDGGATWPGRARLSGDVPGNGADQFHQGIAVDGQGRVHAVLWDRRGDPENLLIQAVHARFDPDTQVLTEAFLTAPFDPDPGHIDGQFLGDYNTADAAGGRVALAFNVATPQKPGTHNTNIPWDLDVWALVVDA